VTIDISPISKTGVSDMLVQQILGFVTAGQLRAGDKLPSERVLAERFQVSRPTVREAMRALSVLGVVEIRHGGGAFVSELNAADLLGPLNFFLSLSEVSVEKLYQARRLIEGELCALAAKSIEDNSIEQLRDMILKQEQVKADADAYLKLDSAFHELIAEVANNPFLARAAASLNVLGVEFRKRAATTKQAQDRSIQDHWKILEALTARDQDLARSAMAAHMEQVFETTSGVLGDEHG
jgi:DNA-binding FadR family transcriptional regulator